MRPLLVTLLLMSCEPVPDCGSGGWCVVDGGRYLALPPADWDGRTALAVTVHHHGYGGSADRVSSAITRAFSDQGRLLVLPDGEQNTWSHVGSPTQARDELAFHDAMVADIRARFPVKEDGWVASGFSQGGSMAWDLACYRGEMYLAFTPISGAFWEPLPETCPAGPVNMRHLHGLDDSVVPMEGRPIGSARQGSVRESIGILRDIAGCSDESRIESVPDTDITCEVAVDCEREVWLCLHDGGHSQKSGWVARTTAWAESLR